MSVLRKKGVHEDEVSGKFATLGKYLPGGGGNGKIPATISTGNGTGSAWNEVVDASRVVGAVGAEGSEGNNEKGTGGSFDVYADLIQQIVGQRKAAALSALEAQYGRDSEALEKSRWRSQENARVSYEKLQKYLPTLMKQQGLSGLGVSQTAALRMNQSHANRMGQIESDYSDALRELSAQYAEGRSEIEQTAGSEALAAYQIYLDNKYNQDVLDLQKNSLEYDRTRNETLDTEAKQKELYDDIVNKITEGEFDTSEEMYNYIEKNKAGLSDNYYNSIMAKANSYAPDIDEIAEDEAYYNDLLTTRTSQVTLKDDFAEDGTFKIQTTYDNSIKVKSGGEVTDDAVIRASADVANGEVFGYNRQLYIKVNGAIYSVVAKNQDDYTTLYNYMFQ